MKKRTPETNLAHYLEAGKGWETDEIAGAKRSERRAWRVAIGAGALAGLAVLAVAMLTPLKTVEPFIVKVDKVGAADVVTLLKERTVTGNEAIDKYWLGQYVNFREEYSKTAAYGNYQATKLLSDPTVAAMYEKQVVPDNPASPTAVFADKGYIETKITNVSFIGKQHAQVRFVRKETKDASLTPQESRWIATITYEYVNPPMDEAARLINPIGFRVTAYRIDPETNVTSTPAQAAIAEAVAPAPVGDPRQAVPGPVPTLPQAPMPAGNQVPVTQGAQ